MALHLQNILSTPSYHFRAAGFIHHRINLPQRFIITHPSRNHRCLILSNVTSPDIIETTTERRSGNYQRSIWDFNFLQSLTSDYKDGAYKSKAKKLEEQVRQKLGDERMEPLSLLELIDDIERLGIGYLFEEDIKKVLDTIVQIQDIPTRTSESLHATALQFRLLRQHGYEVNQGMFDHLKDKAGNFKARYTADAQGILSLYETSHLAIDGESMLVEAKNFAVTALREITKSKNIEPNLAKLVSHALELPLYWRITKLEARWYMDVYEKKKDSFPALFQLAQLDFNIVQAMHLQNLAEISRWSKNLGLAEKLSFARDSLVPCFLWTVGMNPEPQFSKYRIDLCKINWLITVIDDVYDIYGTLEELELFTDAVERWDTKAIEQLPEYMKICFLALFNTVNDIAYFHLKEHGVDSIPFLKKVWTDLCKAYLREAKWYHSGHKTTLGEYLNNAVISIAGNVMIGHSFFLLPHSTIRDQKALDHLSQDDLISLIRYSSMVVRLADDRATSVAELERGDTLKSIQSYMYEIGVSEDVAREHIGNMIDEAWRKMNRDIFNKNDPLYPHQNFIKAAANYARMSQCIYQFGDGHGIYDDVSKDRANSLLFEPIPLLMDA